MINGHIRGLPRRRMIVVPVVVLSVVMVLAMVITVSIAVFTAPAAAPVAVAATVLGSAVEVFGDGDGEGSLSGSQLVAAANKGDVTCDLAPVSEDNATETAAATVPTSTLADSDTDADPQDSVRPVPLGRGGTINQKDAAMLIAPLDLGVSSLKAHVWFLYRLAGLGDWDAFTTAYRAAGLRDDEDSEDAPLRQVQRLNSTVSDIGRYRLTAAALVTAGEQTGRFTDPHPRYREMVAIELMSSCMSGTGTDQDRMTLPPPGLSDSALR